MRSVLVVITNVVFQQPSQVPPIENNHVVQKLSTYAADPALGHPVLLRTAECSAHRLGAHRLYSRNDIGTEFRVAIADQETMRPLAAFPDFV